MDRKSILIVEDEPSIAEVVALYLQRAGFQTIHAADGLTARSLLEQQAPDLGIIDIMIPEMDGLSLTRWLRGRSNMPIILLTARRAESDRIAGLELGADDYVVKPFSPQELVSRVRAVLRRTGREPNEPPSSQKLEFGDLVIDQPGRLVTLSGRQIPLTAREFDMLALLALHPRQVFTRDQLLERVWGVSDYIDPGTVTVHVRRLREKLEHDPSAPRRILTVWGVGYKFEP
ncbi:MAG TPA: response regulator transcription factor [Anaerolineales bacterium]